MGGVVLLRLFESPRVRVGLALGWTLLILILCWMPTRDLGLARDDSRWLKIPHLDKLVHATLFGGFALLWFQVTSFRRSWPLIVAAGLFMAVGTEYVQGLPFVGRDADIWDGLADSVGLFLGTIGAVALKARWQTTRFGKLAKCPSPS